MSLFFLLDHTVLTHSLTSITPVIISAAVVSTSVSLVASVNVFNDYIVARVVRSSLAAPDGYHSLIIFIFVLVRLNEIFQRARVLSHEMLGSRLRSVPKLPLPAELPQIPVQSGLLLRRLL